MGKISKMVFIFLLILLPTIAYCEGINEEVHSFTFKTAQATDCSGCSAQFKAGTEVTLTATPDTGSVFMWWSGDFCNGSKVKTCTFIMPNKDVHIDARFDKRLASPKWRKSIGSGM